MAVLATTKGKEFALKALADRRDNPPTQIDNSSLPAGSPMYFYCNYCSHLSDTLPEGYLSRPSHICAECKALKDAGWLQ